MFHKKYFVLQTLHPRILTYNLPTRVRIMLHETTIVFFADNSFKFLYDNIMYAALV